MRRLGAAVALLFVLLVTGAAGASAVPNPVDPVGDAIVDKLCPPRVAPYPASPDTTVMQRGGGPGGYAQYGYAGLRWTTWDAGCLSWDKADTSIGSQINAAANAVDQLTNEVQMMALDDDTTAAFDGVIVKALEGLRAAFWNPWSLIGVAAAGFMIAVYFIGGRSSDAFSLLMTGATVLVVITAVLMRPTAPAELGNALTSGVALKVSDSLVAATPGGSMPASATTQQKFGEGFYQVSYRAWLEGSFCGDAGAAETYGPRLRDAQAFTVDEAQRAAKDPELGKKIVEGKRKNWERIGEAMEKTHPVAFGCWKGEGTSRMAAGVKHAVVTIGAGFWIMLGSVALLALKWVLRLALLFAVTFGALMLFSRRLTDRMTEFALLGLLGPPFIAAGVGTMLWGYYAILLDNTQAWWQAGVAAFALGLAVFMSKSIIERAFIGVRTVDRVGHMGKRGASKVRHLHTETRTSSSARGAAAGAVVGGAAGAAAGAAVAASQDGDDARRQPEPSSEPSRQVDVDARGPGTDAAAQALSRARALSYGRYEERGEEPPMDGARVDRVVMDEAQALEPEPPAPAADDAPREAPSSAAAAPTRRHGRDWRKAALEDRSETDRAAWARASGVVSQTFGQGDDRRDDA